MLAEEWRPHSLCSEERRSTGEMDSAIVMLQEAMDQVSEGGGMFTRLPT